jgi:signal peptidase I
MLDKFINKLYDTNNKLSLLLLEAKHIAENYNSTELITYIDKEINGSSMEPTLNDKELVIVNKIGLKTSGLKRFDIVTAKYESDTLIKRVIGLPNETVEYIDNELYINGEKVRLGVEKKM